MKRGLFIVIEGVDGSGKTTAAKHVAAFLRTREGQKVIKGRNIFYTEEPTKGPIGGFIKDIVHSKRRSIYAPALQLLFSADRAEHAARDLEPHLRRGDCIISDRSFFSTLAYATTPALRAWLWNVNKYFPQPDLVFLVDVPIEVAMTRIAHRRAHKSIFDTRRELMRIHANYGILKKKFRTIVHVDGNRNVGEITNDIVHIIERRLRT